MIELEDPSPDTIEEAIKRRESFLLVNIPKMEDMMRYCNLLDSMIKEMGMSCRIFSRGRTLVTIPILYSPPGVAILLAQIAHNLATFNPDWKIIRNIIKKKIEVRYCHAKK